MNEQTQKIKQPPCFESRLLLTVELQVHNNFKKRIDRVQVEKGLKNER